MVHGAKFPGMAPLEDHITSGVTSPIYPLVICYITMERSTIDFMNFPMNSMVMFHSYVKLPKGRYGNNPFKNGSPWEILGIWIQPYHRNISKLFPPNPDGRHPDITKKENGQDALDLHSTCPHPWWKNMTNNISGWWLTYPYEKYESQLGKYLPGIYGKIKKCSKPPSRSLCLRNP